MYEAISVYDLYLGKDIKSKPNFKQQNIIKRLE